MTTANQQGKSVPTVFWFISIYLIVRFLWAVLVPGGEWPVSPSHYISMGIDLLLLVALFGLRSRLSEVPDNSRRATATILFWFGVVAGVGLLLIRFTSDAAWWTGHLTN
jgi:lipid-A-disaccharide synthase-like uncharacterized protein